MNLRRRDGGHEARARLALTRRDTMKPEDETFLSALIDGELDLDQRSAVEAALLSDPQMAERLRQLSTVRELIVSLPRPTPRTDVSGSVMARIRQRSAGSARRRRRLLVRAVGGFAAAAAVGMAALLGPNWTARTPRPAAPPRPILAAPSAARSDPPSSVAAISEHATQADPKPGRLAARSVTRREVVRSVPSPRFDSHAFDLRRERDQTTIRDLLDSPDLTHVFIVQDVIGGDAGGRVNDLVRVSPRLEPDFGRIVVQQGITIDPKHPGKATVFALVMDEDEMARFRARLTRSFPGAVEEGPPDSEVVTRLSDIGDVAILSGTRATELLNPAEVDVPPKALATRTEPKTKGVSLRPLVNDEFPELPVREAEPLPLASEAASEIRTEPERELSGPPVTPRAPHEPAEGQIVAHAGSNPVSDSQPSRPSPLVRNRKASIVLVWVAAPPNRLRNQ